MSASDTAKDGYGAGVVVTIAIDVARTVSAASIAAIHFA
jgi:hypothetical protein